jgi:hypothetical protein
MEMPLIPNFRRLSEISKYNNADKNTPESATSVYGWNNPGF